MPASKELVPLADYKALAAGSGAAELVRDTLAGQEVNEFDLTRIRVPAGGATTFEIPSRIGEDEASKQIEGIILFHKASRAYWESKYSGGSEPPDCSSNDAETAEPRDNEDGPSVIIPATRDDVTGRLLCHTCGNNAWGSAPNRDDGSKSKGKACRETRQVFLLTPKRMLPVVLVLPPTSIRVFTRYLMGLADEGVNWRGITTTVTLVKREGDGPAYSEADFKLGETLSGDQVSKVDAYRAASEPAFMQYAEAHAEQAVQESDGEPAA
jgi:hypothetical protein